MVPNVNSHVSDSFVCSVAPIELIGAVIQAGPSAVPARDKDDWDQPLPPDT